MQPQKKKKQPKKISPTYLKNSGLYYLQRYIASSYQFERAMKRKIDRSCYVHTEQNKEECHEWLYAVTKEFQKLGLLNDELYLRGMLNSFRFSKGLSTRMIVQKLRDKGFSESDVLPVLKELESEQHDHYQGDLDAANRFSERKKLGTYHPVPPRKTYDQQLATLARAGFMYDICKKVLENGNFKT